MVPEGPNEVHFFERQLGCMVLKPNNQPSSEWKPHNLTLLEEPFYKNQWIINPIRPAFLETAPLSPFGHFPPLGAACDVKKKLKSNLSWTYIGSPCSEAGFLDSDGYHRTSVIRFSFTVNVFKSPSIISVLNDFGRFWPAQRGGSSLSLYWRWWKECSSTSAARFACFPSAVRLV